MGCVCFQVMHEYSALENFWRRYNKVLLDKLALDREKQILEEENSKLKALLKQYLDGMYTISLAISSLLICSPLANKKHCVFPYN